MKQKKNKQDGPKRINGNRLQVGSIITSMSFINGLGEVEVHDYKAPVTITERLGGYEYKVFCGPRDNEFQIILDTNCKYGFTEPPKQTEEE